MSNRTMSVSKLAISLQDQVDCHNSTEAFYFELMDEADIKLTESDIDPTDDDEDIEIEVVDLNVPHPSEEPIPSKIHMVAATDIISIIPRSTDADDEENDFVSSLKRMASQKSQQHLHILNLVFDLIQSQFLFETSPSAKNVDRKVAKMNMTRLNAQKLKHLFTFYSAPHRDAILFVHRSLVELCPLHFLQAYLHILKIAHSLNSSSIDNIVGHKQDSPIWKQVSNIIMDFVSVNSEDLDEDPIDLEVKKNWKKDVIFILLAASSKDESLAMNTIFKWLESTGNVASEIIRPQFNEDRELVSPSMICDTFIDQICEKIEQKRRENLDTRIVLVGHGWTTYAAHFAANFVHGISAIISLGFPVVGSFGVRGGIDDCMLRTYCPTLFVVGAESKSFEKSAMENLRSSMLKFTGLVVVNHSSDDLIVSSNFLSRFGMTQNAVFRQVFDKIIAFLELEETHCDRSKLKPLDSNNFCQIEPDNSKEDDKSLKLMKPAEQKNAHPKPANVEIVSKKRKIDQVSESGDHPSPSSSRRYSLRSAATQKYGLSDSGASQSTQDSTK